MTPFCKLRTSSDWIHSGSFALPSAEDERFSCDTDIGDRTEGLVLNPGDVSPDEGGEPSSRLTEMCAHLYSQQDSDTISSGNKCSF